MTKWDIPEKSIIKAVAQRRTHKVRKELKSKLMAQNKFSDFFPCIFPSILKIGCGYSVSLKWSKCLDEVSDMIDPKHTKITK